MKTKKTFTEYFKPIETTYKIENTFEFWRNSFLFYWIFSFVGHLLEYVWAVYLILNNEPSPLYTIPFFVVAAPYGLGALGVIWILYPLVQKKKINPVQVFFISIVIATIIELICSLLVIMVLGSNPIWDYSDQFMNLGGHVCLRNSIAFGFACLLLVYYIFPLVNNFIKKQKAKYVNIAFWIISIGYILAQIPRLF